MKDVRLNKDVEVTEILKLIAPGTQIRQGLENILKAKTGALIVVGDSRRNFKFSRWRFLYK